MSKPSRKRPAGKAGKPQPDFPLTIHPRGYWCKKVHGRTHYFGKVADDPNGKKALDRWLDEKDALLAGRTPTVHPANAPTVARLCNDFLNHKGALRDAGEIKEATFGEYKACAKRMAKQFGRDRPVDDLVADDFARLRQSIARQWGPVRLANEIQRVRSIFKFGYESGLLDKRPRFGPSFKKPSAKVLRQNRARRGLRMFERSAVGSPAGPTARGPSAVRRALPGPARAACRQDHQKPQEQSAARKTHEPLSHGKILSMAKVGGARPMRAGRVLLADGLVGNDRRPRQVQNP